MVRREALLARLGRGPTPRLTLVRAPAGWGKSSLLAAWEAEDSEQRPFAWLGLDPGDNDPVRFFLYAIEALRSIAPEVGERSAEVLRAPAVSLVDDVLPLLINELEALPGPAVLAIDDYHVITSSEIHEAVAFLLDHLPPTLELVISTRAEPPLPLARLRGRGDLREVTTTELRFSSAEAATLLEQAEHRDLTGEDVTRLVERTEGWPAGLYLAALSLQGRDDAHEFIRDFTGDDRLVVDYLTAEVLAGQDDDLRDFLLATSVLDRFDARLCDAVTGREGSAAVLRTIESSNLFLVPLDTRREWYRYHHLFAELLRHELRLADPARERELHRRAAAWLREREMPSQAIAHTIAAGDTASAAEQVAEGWMPLVTSGEHETVRRWLDALPRETQEHDARLCVGRAMTAIGSGDLDDVEPWLARAAEAPAAGPFYDGFASGPAAAACLRTVHRWLTGDLGGCRGIGESALAGESEASPWDAVTSTPLGSAVYWLGDPGEGVERLEAGLRLGRAAEFHAPAISALGMLALVELLFGDARAARERAAAAFALSEEAGLLESWINAPGHAARGGVLLLDGAGEEGCADLERALELTRRVSQQIEAVATLVLLSRAAHEGGDRESARQFLADARWTLESCPDPGPVATALLETEERRLRVSRTRPGPVSAEEFSDREIAVLRLLSGDLSQREIGNALYISFNTVKTHCKSIYRKLGVSGRADAVARARELELF